MRKTRLWKTMLAVIVSVNLLSIGGAQVECMRLSPKQVMTENEFLMGNILYKDRFVHDGANVTYYSSSTYDPGVVIESFPYSGFPATVHTSHSETVMYMIADSATPYREYRYDRATLEYEKPVLSSGKKFDKTVFYLSNWYPDLSYIVSASANKNEDVGILWWEGFNGSITFDNNKSGVVEYYFEDSEVIHKVYNSNRATGDTTLDLFFTPENETVKDIVMLVQCGCACKHNNSTVNMSSGNQHNSFNIVSAQGGALPLSFTLHHNSLDSYKDGPISANWTHSYNILLSDNGDTITEKREEGQPIKYTLNEDDNIYYPESRWGINSKIVVNADDTYSMTRNESVTYLFDANGKLLSITDLNGNQNTLTYDANDHLSTVSDSSGRSMTLVYDANGQLSEVNDSDGNITTIVYNTDGMLEKITRPDTTYWQFTYDEDTARILTKRRPDGKTFGYIYNEEDGRVIAAVDPNSNMNQVIYDDDNDTAHFIDKNGKESIYYYDENLNVTLDKTDPEGHKVAKEFDEYRNTTKITDAKGNVTSKEYAVGPGCSSCGGSPTKVTDPAGNITEHTYDNLGNRTSTKNALDITTSWVYDEQGNQVGENLPNGAVTEFEYDSYGNLVKETDALGNETTYTFDTAGNMTSKTNALGETTTFTYDSMGRRLTTTDPAGATSSVLYDINGNIIKQIDAAGNETVFTYDSMGNKTSSTDPDGTTTTFAYNFEGQTTLITYADGTTEAFGYDPEGQKTSSTDRKGNVTTYQYTDSGNLQKVTNADGTSMEYAYDANGNKTSVTDQNGKVTSYEYDNLDRTVKTTDPDGRVVSYVYDAISRQTSVTTPEGTTSYEYDVVGNTTKITDPEGRETTYEYDLLGRQTAVIDPLGNRTEYEFDALGRITKTTDPSGASSESVYDSRGNLIKKIDALGRTTTYEYDELNRLIKVTDPLGNVSEYGYDQVGNRTSVTDPAGKITTFEYDINNRLVKTVYPDGSTIQNLFDANGNLIKTIDQNGNSKTYAYDALNRKVSETDAMGNTVTFEYDNNGNQVKFTTADSNSTTMTYSDTNQLLIKTQPDGSTRSNTYDSVGRIATVTNARGQVVTYAYDQYGKLTGKTWDTGSEAFSYDQVGRLTTATHTEISASGGSTVNTITYTYDNIGRVLTETQNGSTVTYQYDLVGNKTRIAYPSGKTVDYSYTDGDRIGTVTVDSLPLLTYNYDARGLVTGANYNSGMTMTKSYDDVGRILSVKYEMNNQIIDGYEYTYDLAGNRLSKTNLTDADKSEVYSYDSIYQLTQYLQGSIESNAIAEPTDGKAWTYDVMGNWLGTEEAISFSDDFEMKPWHHYGWNHSWNHGSWSHDRQNNRGRGYGHGWSWGHNNNNPKDDWKTHLDEFVSNYEIVSGEWKLQPKRLFCRARNEKSILLLNSENLTDPVLQVDLSECGSFLNNGGAGFIFAYQNADNYCFAGVGNSIIWQSWSKENKHGKGGKGHGHAVPCKTFVIGKVANGQGEILASDSKEISWWNRHLVESVKLTVTSTQIDLALINRRNGEAETVLSHTCEIAVPEGKVGLGVHSSGRRSETATFDDFQVKALIIDKNEYNSANALVLKDGKVFLYDADGNMIDDSSKTYEWNVFNRLTSVTTSEANVEFSYDSQGRRTSKTVDVGNDGVIEKTITYVYDGWNCIESTTTENDVASTKTYVWGIDLSGSTQGAGGVGGLLTETNDTGTYTACSDANGNVTAYVSADGSKVAEYVYTPFGRLESADGDMVDEFFYRYSTKPIDSETGLYYFGYRYYSPELGRWISRDPIGENGGWNLYQFCSNSAVNNYDMLGLWKKSDHVSFTELSIMATFPATGQSNGEQLFTFVRNTIVNANTNVDDSFSSKLEYHFNRPLWNYSDNAISLWKKKYSDNLKRILNEFKEYLNKPNVGNCEEALKKLGELSHAWQDYYGHAIKMDSNGYNPGKITGNPDGIGSDMKPSSWGGWAAPGEHTPFGVIHLEPGDRAEDSAARRAQSESFVSGKFNSLLSDTWIPKCSCIITSGVLK